MAITKITVETTVEHLGSEATDTDLSRYQDHLLKGAEKMSQQELSELWDSLSDGATYRVLDEDGVNMAGAMVRRIDEETWLYVDEVDGYRVVSDEDVQRLLLDVLLGAEGVNG
jgi:ATP-dependent protease HslVU (ClpYQ) ATPase subunit